jgi:LPXTG-motif cell wall-anchored protein
LQCKMSSKPRTHSEIIALSAIIPVSTKTEMQNPNQLHQQERRSFWQNRRKPATQSYRSQLLDKWEASCTDFQLKVSAPHKSENKMKNSKSKKIVSLLLAGCISASMMSVTAWAEKIEGGGYTPIESPASRTEQETPKTSCTKDGTCTADEHEEGCPKAEPKDKTPETTCTKDETCTADEHEEGCPLYVAPVPETTCTGDENCTAEEHKEGCPKAEPKDETPELECNCGVAEGEAHKEGCPLYTVPAPETPVVPEAVQLAMEKIASLIDFVAHTEEQIPATDGTTVTKIRVTMLEKLDPAKDEELKELIAREEAALRDETQPALTEEEAARLEQARSAFESAKERYLTDAFSNAHLAANTAFEALTADQQAQVENASQLAAINENLAYIMQAVNTLSQSNELKYIRWSGYDFGLHYNSKYGPSRCLSERKSNKISWDTIKDTVFSFSLLDRNQNDDAGAFFDDKGEYTEKIQNPWDGRIWNCVGFVPVTSTLSYYSDYAPYIYIPQILEGMKDKELSDELEKNCTLDDVKKFILASGGILYGDKLTEDNIKSLEAKIDSSNILNMVCVWYVEPKAPLEHGDYGELSITPVSPVDYQPTSTGVSLSCGEASIISQNPYTVSIDITVTIDTTAPDQVHINVTDILGEAKEKVENADGVNMIQPGDHVVYRLKVDDQSGKDYQYRIGSAQLGTIPGNGTGNQGTGFEGYQLFEDNGDGYGMVPNRFWGAPLQEIGVPEYNVGDAAVGKKLLAAGYGNESMESADITKKYLANYYLDYFNRNREDGNKATSFENLTVNEFGQLAASGMGNAAIESCSDVAEALYYLYYDRIYSVNGVSVYQHMKDNSKLDQDIARTLNSNNSLELLTSELDGEHMTDLFMGTVHGFGMQFDMNIPAPTPDPTPTPDPDPTPNPDPNPKDEGGEPDPDPRPRTTIDDEPTPRTNRPETVAIEDSEVPLTDAPELVTIDDEQVPLKDNPETGDASSALPSLAAAALSLTGLAVLCKKKKQ